MHSEQVVILIRKHLAGELSAPEAGLLSDWINASDENARLFENLKDPEYLTRELCRFDTVDVEGNWKKLLTLQKPATVMNQQPALTTSRRTWFVAAAVLFLLLASTWLLSDNIPFFNKKTFLARSGEKLSFRLADGSQVILNSGSKLFLEKGFNKSNRGVKLEGEAYFDIVKNETIPFIIHTNTMKVSVLGTAFNVRAYPEEKAEITSLIRGKIIVTIPEEKNDQSYTLESYQKLTVHKAGIEAHTISGNKIRQPLTKDIRIDSLKKSEHLGNIAEIAWMENKLVFDNEPMESVAAKIEKWYGIRVIIETPGLKEIKCTGSFETEPLDKVLESMQFSIPKLNYRKEQDNAILVLYK